jgi:F-type H+-transporting ATPase subunit b
LENLGINLGFLIVQILNFAIIFIVVRAWIYKPLLNMLEKRKLAIAQGLEDARVAADARANAEKEAKRILSEAQIKANQLINSATEKAEVAAREVKEAAEGEALKLRQEKLAEVVQQKSRILGELREQVAYLSVAAARKFIGEALLKDEKRQHELIDEFFSGVKTGKVVVWDEAASIPPGASAEVVSALPLKPEEKEIVRDWLAKKGSAVVVSFREDPSILGGLILRVGDRVIDGSVSSQLHDLGQSIR